MSELDLTGIKSGINAINENIEKCISEISDANVHLIEIKYYGELLQKMDQISYKFDVLNASLVEITWIIRAVVLFFIGWKLKEFL